VNRDAVGYKTVFGAVIIIILSLASAAHLWAQDCRVVSISGKAEGASAAVEPARMEISRGDCVVWYNRSADANIRISFEEGKKCSNATKASDQFSLNTFECFVNSWVPVGGTSSLSFQDQGTYKYTVEVASGGPETLDQKGKKIAEGEIVVSQ